MKMLDRRRWQIVGTALLALLLTLTVMLTLSLNSQSLARVTYCQGPQCEAGGWGCSSGPDLCMVQYCCDSGDIPCEPGDSWIEVCTMLF